MSMELAKKFLLGEKGAGDVLASSAFFVVIEGYEELLFLTKTLSLPMLKNGIIEYSTPTGTKTFGKGKNQTKVELPITFQERENHTVKEAWECIAQSGKNGELTARIYSGDGEFHESSLWGEVILGFMVNEDFPDGDSEGDTAGLTVNFTLHGHYFPDKDKPTRNEPLRTQGIQMSSELIAVDGTRIEC